jgi:metallophosphoesterase superfamily enzyme
MSQPSLQAVCPARIELRPDIWLDSRLALWLAELRILVVADLHWGYAASHRVQGNLLPAWGDAEITSRLRALITDYEPAEMIWLGDSLHTLVGSDGANNFLQTCEVPVSIVSGNHDARWNRAKDRFSVLRSNYFFHHGDQPRARPAETIEIIGHHHPAVAWYDGAGTRLKMPALIMSPHRLVLPAFSPWAAGVPWISNANGETIYAITPKRIFTVPRAQEQKGPTQ